MYHKQVCKKCGKKLQRSIIKYCTKCAINNYNNYKYGVTDGRRIEKEIPN